MQDQAEPKTDRDHLLVLERGLSVLEAFTGRPRLTISETAALTGLSRAACRRCLITLERLGFAESEGRAWHLTPKVLRLSQAYLSSNDLLQMLRPQLERVAAELEESCSAAVLDGTEILYVARAARRRLMSADVGVGVRLPAYCTSMGRVLLTAMPPEAARAVLARSTRRPLTPRTITDIPALEAELHRVAEQGYSVVNQELEPGLVSISIPVRDSAGRVLVAVNVSSHSERVPAAEMAGRVLPSLRRLQQELSFLL
jgi:IclR family transcriptional regulator, pca regulon regulatory protein